LATGTQPRIDRRRIVTECANAVAACFNHYSDTPLDPETVAEIKTLLDNNLPQRVTTEHWQQYADQHEAEVRAQGSDDDTVPLERTPR
jgi:hypothetical protein